MADFLLDCNHLSAACCPVLCELEAGIQQLTRAGSRCPGIIT
jgi:hypothetical protein